MSFLLSWEWKVIKLTNRRKMKLKDCVNKDWLLAENMTSSRPFVEQKTQSTNRNIRKIKIIIRHVVHTAMSLRAQNNGEKPKCSCRNMFYVIIYISFKKINILTKCITHLGAVVSEPAQCGSCGLSRWTYLSYRSVKRQVFFNERTVKRLFLITMKTSRRGFHIWEF